MNKAFALSLYWYILLISNLLFGTLTLLAGGLPWQYALAAPCFYFALEQTKQLRAITSNPARPAIESSTPSEFACFVWEIRHAQKNLLEAGVIKEEDMSVCEDPRCPECKTTREHIASAERKKAQEEYSREIAASYHKKQAEMRSLAQYPENQKTQLGQCTCDYIDIKNHMSVDPIRKIRNSDKFCPVHGKAPAAPRSRMIDNMLVIIPDAVPTFASVRWQREPMAGLILSWYWTDEFGNSRYFTSSETPASRRQLETDIGKWKANRGFNQYRSNH